MRFYECTVILCPELSKQQIEEVQNELTDIIKSFDGNTSRHEYWGLRSLAYPIEKFTRAHYIFFNISVSKRVSKYEFLIWTAELKNMIIVA